MDQAESIYKGLLAQHPQHPEYLVGMAKVNAAKNKTDDEAFAVYQSAIKVNPQMVPVLEQLFKIYAVRKDIDPLVKTGASLLELNPDSRRIMVPELEKAVINHPIDTQLVLLLGDAYTAGHHSEYALSCYNRAADVSLDAPIPERIIQGISQILEYDPGDKTARIKRAKLYQNIRQPESAALDYEWIRQADPADTSAVAELLRLYHELSESNPGKKTHFQFLLGNLYQSQKQWQDAILEYQQTAKTPEFSLASNMEMGRCFLAMEQPDIAYSQIAELPPSEDLLSLMYDISQRFLKSGQLEKSLLVLDKIKKYDPHYRDISILLNQTLLKKQEIISDRTVSPATNAPGSPGTV